VQTGSPYSDNPTEPNWQLQAIVVGLSTGPNGPSDKIGATNASLVMSTIRSDGLTLQPDRPATVMDAALLKTFDAGTKGLVPDVRSTWTAYAGHAFRWSFVLSISLGTDFTFTRADLGPAGSAPAVAVFDFFNPAGPLATLTAPGDVFSIPQGQGQPSAPSGSHGIRYYVIVPQLPGGWLLYGEQGKVVPMSHQRTSDVKPLADGFTATVASAGETGGVTMLVSAPSAAGVLSPVVCPPKGPAPASSTLSCTAGACTCV
jgi:hypothetical protein